MTQHTVQLSLTEDEYEQLVYLLDPGKVDWEREIDERILVRKLRAAWDQILTTALRSTQTTS